MYKQTSLTFHTSNNVCKRCWEEQIIMTWIRFKPLPNCIFNYFQIMCSWKWEKLKVFDKELTLHEKKIGFFNVSIRDKWKCISICISLMIGLLWRVCNYIQYFFHVVRNTPNNKHSLELIKRRSKVQERNITWERALNFDQWKTINTINNN